MIQFLFTAPKIKVNPWYWYRPKKVSTNIFIWIARFFVSGPLFKQILPNVKYSVSKWDRGRRSIEPIVLLVVLCWWFEILGQAIFWGFGQKLTKKNILWSARLNRLLWVQPLEKCLPCTTSHRVWIKIVPIERSLHKLGHNFFDVELYYHHQDIGKEWK